MQGNGPDIILLSQATGIPDVIRTRKIQSHMTVTTMS